MTLSGMKDEPMYPEFTIQGDEDLDLPHEGTMVIEYRKKSSEEVIDPDGDEHYSCRICVKKLVSVKESAIEPTKDSSLDSEDALDKLAKEKLAANDESGDY